MRHDANLRRHGIALGLVQLACGVGYFVLSYPDSYYYERLYWLLAAWPLQVAAGASMLVLTFGLSRSAVLAVCIGGYLAFSPLYTWLAGIGIGLGHYELEKMEFV